MFQDFEIKPDLGATHPNGNKKEGSEKGQQASQRTDQKAASTT
ncbi:MAG TPA: hypothetical protein VGD99_16180 [Anaerolineae bacterium]